MRARRDGHLLGPASHCLGLLVVVFTVWLPGASPVAADERDFFDPDGYYFPTSDMAVSGYKIEWLSLTTLEYYYEGALHYDRPRLITPAARLALTRLADGKTSTHDCPRPSISRDSLAVVCFATPIGIVSIRGAFLDKRGQFWNRNDIVSQQTIVAVATVTATRNGKEEMSHRVSFTYSQGD